MNSSDKAVGTRHSERMIRGERSLKCFDDLFFIIDL